MSKLEEQVKRDMGKDLTAQLNRASTRVARPSTSYNARPSTSYNIHTDTYQSGIETWHARGAEHHLVQQLEERLERMQALHHEEMCTLVRQVTSMNELTEARVMHINGFYTWLIETYPETVAQYKALLNLKQLTEGEE
jgi:hypothetical protein